MENDFWLSKWQTNDIPFHEQNIHPDLIQYFPELNVKPGDTILVPLCGKSKDMQWLLEQGLHVIGIELSSIACADFFKDLNLSPVITKEGSFTRYAYNQIEILCGDLFLLKKGDLPKIDAVYDCKALIALAPAIREKYLQQILLCHSNKLSILLLTRESPCQVLPPPYPINYADILALFGPYFDIKQLKNLSLTKIPERLIKKGYTEIKDTVYLISKK